MAGYIAGHFNAFYSPGTNSGTPTYQNIGSTREGIRHIVSFHEQAVADDAFGEAQPEAIQQGVDNTLRLDYVQYGMIKAALYTQTPEGGCNANVGQPLTSLSGPLVLVPVAGTPAAADLGTGNCYIFYFASIVTDVEVLLASKLRQGPATFRAWPSPLTGTVYAITTTPAGCNATNPI
jgi:hypothetical protein